MPKKIIIEPHLQVDEIEKRYRNARDGVARGQWQVIWLLALDRSTTEIEAVTGYSKTWIRTIARRYNASGASGLGDRRRFNRGAEPSLNEEQQAQLRAALRKRAPDGGNWNSRKVAAWIADTIGGKVSAQIGWTYMRRLTGQQRRPRRTKRSK